MSRNKNQEDALHVALKDAFLPVARALIGQGITAAEVQSAVGQSFVSAAFDVAKLKNGKINQSKVAIVTGYSRTEIRKILSGIRKSIDGGKAFGAKKILDGWARDPEYSSRTGIQKPLPVRGRYGSFYSLAKKFSGDIPPKAALDELLRTGHVELRQSRVHVVKSERTSESRKTAELAAICAKLVQPFRDAAVPLAQSAISSDDVLQFEFDVDSALLIAEDRVRQNARAFMNGVSASMSSMGIKKRRSGVGKRAQLKINVSISRELINE